MKTQEGSNCLTSCIIDSELVLKARTLIAQLFKAGRKELQFSQAMAGHFDWKLILVPAQWKCGLGKEKRKIITCPASGEAGQRKTQDKGNVPRYGDDG